MSVKGWASFLDRFLCLKLHLIGVCAPLLRNFDIVCMLLGNGWYYEITDVTMLFPEATFLKNSSHGQYPRWVLTLYKSPPKNVPVCQISCFNHNLNDYLLIRWTIDSTATSTRQTSTGSHPFVAGGLYRNLHVAPLQDAGRLVWYPSGQRYWKVRPPSHRVAIATIRLLL